MQAIWRRPTSKKKHTMRTSIIAAVILAASAAAAQPQGAQDPGIRNDGKAGAGGPLPNLPDSLTKMFLSGQNIFEEVETVAGSSGGLGPTMNLNSCAGCHVNPAIGGTSPANNNPQVSFYMQSLNHTTNSLPFFITPNGPVREARFPSDGGVHNVFTIAGMTGAEACQITQPDFIQAQENNDLIYRIPTPLFGAGLIEQITDSTIITNLTSPTLQNQKLAMGIKGHPNIVLAGNTVSGQPNLNGNDGTVSRFGWKAQNKSLLLFAGEAYNVEMGISNELFPSERNETPACQFLSTPNDTTNPQLTSLAILSDIEQFAAFMRLLAPPVPSATVPGGATSISNGAAVFNQIGCGLCHTPSLPTASYAAIAALGGQIANLFSDLALHHMGPGLADGITQGQAGPDEFRTAPLWGLGKRAFFLHDGRTSDLVVAIHQHRSGPNAGVVASEANTVINNYDMLPNTAKQNLLNFLRSL
ncbi:MAG TPA: di-heme oxidoredictase family protein [Methylocella sp.]|nr:di-heme oxidoredictase family protein [Methylocella sp.]